MFNAAVDAIAVISADGVVADWNPAAERLFGYPHSAAIGRELGELIIPHSLREAHRAGLRRVRETGEERILNRRLELFGTHADGSLIPVELTVTKIPSDGPELFAGFVRDRRGTEREREPRLPTTA